MCRTICFVKQFAPVFQAQTLCNSIIVRRKEPFKMFWSFVDVTSLKQIEFKLNVIAAESEISCMRLHKLFPRFDQNYGDIGEKKNILWPQDK